MYVCYHANTGCCFLGNWGSAAGRLHLWLPGISMEFAVGITPLNKTFWKWSAITLCFSNQRTPKTLFETCIWRWQPCKTTAGRRWERLAVWGALLKDNSKPGWPVNLLPSLPPSLAVPHRLRGGKQICELISRGREPSWVQRLQFAIFDGRNMQRATGNRGRRKHPVWTPAIT